MALTLDELKQMNQDDLEALFRRSPAGEIPDGDSEGVAIVLPGTRWEKPLAEIAEHWFWQGKVFDKEKGELINKVTPFGLKAIKAKVYQGPSWVDNQPCTVLDYSHTSIVAREVRDEIREVEPGLYLGVVFWGKLKTIDFALQFPNPASSSNN